LNYTDPVFFGFFAITFGVYYLAPTGRSQVLVLILASLFFYAWESPALLTVFLTTWAITSTASYLTLRAPNRRIAKLYATFGVLVNLGMLAFFKYKFLVIPSLAQDVSKGQHSLIDWLILAPLPIGISFYSFHAISLLVDVYRGSNIFKPEEKKNPFIQYLADTLLYLSFFPQLIAGPIIKAKDFYPQVGKKYFRNIPWDAAFKTLVTGYFLKSVIADNLADHTFWISFPYFQWRSSTDLLIMLYGYSAQIFADFAGYSLIAIGLGRLLGYELPQNFNFPYIATSVSDFWRRWHISLSSWLRDYLYIPLGGSKKGEFRTYVNLMAVMLIGGLWHGAAWSFAIWGLWHGIGLALERPWLQSRLMTSQNRFILFARIIIIFNFASIGWLFFKLQNFSEAILFLKTLANSTASGISKAPAFFIGSYGIAVLLYHVFHVKKSSISNRTRNILLGAMIFLIAVNPGPSAPFIYFQF
jgi:alginate O-acetyltransferase complex protein AlgI